MLLKQPYFMENTDWYYHEKKKNRYILTDKALKKAYFIISFYTNSFYISYYVKI